MRQKNGKSQNKNKNRRTRTMANIKPVEKVNGKKLQKVANLLGISTEQENEQVYLQVMDKVGAMTQEDQLKLDSKVIDFFNACIDTKPPAEKNAVSAVSSNGEEKKATRADVFRDIVLNDTDGLTAKEIAERMKEIYGGTDAEANFQTQTFMRVLESFGYGVKEKATKKFKIAIRP
jgi:hypothetical protein